MRQRLSMASVVLVSLGVHGASAIPRGSQGVDASAVLESVHAAEDVALTADPDSPMWKTAPRVIASRDRLGQPVAGPPTEIWYGEMRIPFRAIDVHAPRVGTELRLGLFRIAGAEPSRTRYVWRPTGQNTFHVPHAFGTLRLR